MNRLAQAVKEQNRQGARLSVRRQTKPGHPPYTLTGTDAHGRRTRIEGTRPFLLSMIERIA